MNCTTRAKPSISASSGLLHLELGTGTINNLMLVSWVHTELC